MAVSGVYITYPKARKEYQCQSCNYPILNLKAAIAKYLADHALSQKEEG